MYLNTLELYLEFSWKVVAGSFSVLRKSNHCLRVGPKVKEGEYLPVFMFFWFVFCLFYFGEEIVRGFFSDYLV